MKYKIRASFNPRDVSGESPDINFEGDEQTIDIRNESDLADVLKTAQDSLFNKFGKRKGKARMIIHWAPKVWNNKIIPNIKLSVEANGKKKEGSESDIEGFLKEQLIDVRKPIGIALQVKQHKTSTGRTIFLSFGYYLKDGKKRWGFVKG